MPQDVVALAGAPAGSVFLLDQNVLITVPRVRDVGAGTAVPLATYALWQSPRAHEVDVFRRLWGEILSREYEGAAAAVPEAFGLATSRVSRRVIRANARARQTRQERRQDDAEWLVLVLDGTSFAADQVVIALGVTTTGETRLLGLVQTATEHTRVCAAFLRALVERGFTARRGCSSSSTARRARVPRCATCSVTTCSVMTCRCSAIDDPCRYSR